MRNAINFWPVTSKSYILPIYPFLFLKNSQFFCPILVNQLCGVFRVLRPERKILINFNEHKAIDHFKIGLAISMSGIISMNVTVEK